VSEEGKKGEEAAETKEKALAREAAPYDINEERHRLVAIEASVPLVLLASPLFLPFDGNKSLLSQMLRYPEVLVVALGIGFWPIFLGIVGAIRGRKREAPGKLLFGVPAVVLALISLVATGITGTVLVVELASERYHRFEPIVVPFFLLCALALFVAVRAFWRKGFRRFNHLVACAWLLATAMVLGLFVSDSSMFSPPVAGEWVFLFAIAALAPLLTFAFAPRRA